MPAGVVLDYFPRNPKFSPKDPKARGFGRILVDGPEKSEVLLHWGAVEAAGLPEIAAGARLEFDLETGRDGRVSAINLQREPV